VVTDLIQIQRLGEKKRDENLRFRMHLKRHVFVERRLKKIAEEVEDQIDCTECGNCCRVATTRLKDRDIERLAKQFRVSIPRFLADYTTTTPDEGVILKRDDQRGCIFLEGNLCSIYDQRPDACQHFPHLVRGEGSLIARSWEFVDRATYCPIVYNTLEAWKDEVGFRKS
jgi:Fe-S-cluster containining protein